MIENAHPVFQAFLGTLLTWGLTAAGSALVFVFNSGKVRCIYVLLSIFMIHLTLFQHERIKAVDWHSNYSAYFVTNNRQLKSCVI